MYHISDQMKADDEFHLAYGRALSEWAAIEQRLFFWFQHLTNMPNGVGRAVFYSAKNFNGRMDMLDAVSEKLPLDENTAAFLKSVSKKARQFASSRNALAHGETMFDARGQSPNYLRTILVDGKHNDGTAAAVVTAETLDIIRGNFRELSRLVMDGLALAQGSPHRSTPSLEKCREQVLAMPNQADSQTPSLIHGKTRSQPILPASSPP